MAGIPPPKTEPRATAPGFTTPISPSKPAPPQTTTRPVANVVPFGPSDLKTEPPIITRPSALSDKDREALSSLSSRIDRGEVSNLTARIDDAVLIQTLEALDDVRTGDEPYTVLVAAVMLIGDLVSLLSKSKTDIVFLPAEATRMSVCIKAKDKVLVFSDAAGTIGEVDGLTLLHAVMDEAERLASLCAPDPTNAALGDIQRYRDKINAQFAKPRV